MTDDLTAAFRAAAEQAAADSRARQNPGTHNTESNGAAFAQFLEAQLAEQDQGLNTGGARAPHQGWTPDPTNDTAAAFSAYVRSQH